MLESERLLGRFMGGSDPQRYYPVLVRLAESGCLDLASMVSRRIFLDEVKDALRSIESLDGVRAVDWLGPALGAHTDEIYEGLLGLWPERIAELRSDGVL
jgi:hypothetical protein